MNHQHVKYLLVGGGLASNSAAMALRERNPAGSITLIAQEHTRPYHRPPLSKSFLRREIPREKLFVSPSDWFEKQHVTLRTGRRVSSVDPARWAAILDNGEEISYDALLLATGASPVHLDVPGAHLPNIYYLRTLDDEERLHHAIDKALTEGRLHHGNRRGRAVIVGGGFLGVELAGSLSQMGLGVELIAKSLPWDRFASDSTGKFVARYLEAQGVVVHSNSHPLRIDGDGRVQRVVLDSGAVVDCDLLLVTIGATANKDILRNTSIAAGKAILADEHCQTNLPGIWAAGDCAAVFDPLFGKHRIIDHWEHAHITGALAGRNMAGDRAAYDAVNFFSSTTFDLTLNGWGEARLVDRRLMRGTPTIEDPTSIEIGIAADGRIAQTLFIGTRDGNPAPPELKEFVAKRINVTGLEEQLKDTEVNLKSVLEQR